MKWIQNAPVAIKMIDSILTRVISSLKIKAPSKMVNKGVAKKRTLEIKGLVASRPRKLKIRAKNITNAMTKILKKNSLLFEIVFVLLELERYKRVDETIKTTIS